MVGIRKLIYSENISADFAHIKNYQYVIYQSKLNETIPSAQLIDNENDMQKLLTTQADLQHQALLRRKPTTPKVSSITDDFDCVFLQANPKDNSSDYCKGEKMGFDRPNCEYWQTCEFKAIKGQDCDVIKENVVALVIPIGIVLLASAIVAICCFKKKADIAERENAKIIERLPDFGENQASTRSNKGSKFNSFFKIGSSKEAPHKESFVLDDAPRG